MSTEIIISLIFGGASVISSIFFGLVPNLRKAKIERMQKKIERMAGDLDLFYAIEDELLNEVFQATGQNQQAKKISIRKHVSSTKGGRPLYYSPSDIKKELSN